MYKVTRFIDDGGEIYPDLENPVYAGISAFSALRALLDDEPNRIAWTSQDSMHWEISTSDLFKQAARS